jgi:RNA polymerase sigma-70 factor (ECF subfamily)
VFDETRDRWLGSTSLIMEANRASVSDPDTGPDDRSRPIFDSPTTATSDERRDERAIVDAVLAGDRDAFRHLVDREAASVVRACHRILGDLHEAEDAAQEAFVTAFRSLASWRGDGPFGAWLTRIAVRISLRQVGQRRSVTWLDPSGPGAGVPIDSGSMAADASGLEARPRTDPAMLALRAEREAELRIAVATLPEPYREVVTLRFFGELSLEEIARQTERPVPTVKTHLRRGLLRLRGTVEPGGDA